MDQLIIFPCNATALEALDFLNEYEIIGFVDDSPEKHGKQFFGIPVFDRALFAKFPHAKVLAVPGGPDTFYGKPDAINSLPIAKERFITKIHSSANISSTSTIGTNVLIMPGVVITSNVVIEDHVVILPNSVIHHDVQIGAFTFVGSNVSIAGGAKIGNNCFIGSGSSLIQNCKIGDKVLVGLGSVLLNDVGDGSRVAGNPARYI